MNHPFLVSEITSIYLQAGPFGGPLGLNQTAADGIANQACCFVDVQLLHEPCSERFGSFYTDRTIRKSVGNPRQMTARGHSHSRLDQTPADRVAHKAGCLVNIQFLHEPHAVRFSRFHADTKDGSSVLCGFSFRN